eukprot:830984_1
MSRSCFHHYQPQQEKNYFNAFQILCHLPAQKYSTAYVGMTFTFKEKDGRYAPANKAKGAIHKKCTSMKVLLDRNDFKQDFKELEEDWNGFVLQFEFKDLEEEV